MLLRAGRQIISFRRSPEAGKLPQASGKLAHMRLFIRHSTPNTKFFPQLLDLADFKADSRDKAILAFTIVTIIFLPLSFITSYLGMNTADIRTTNATQHLFWAIAAPIAVIALLIGATLAYGFDAVSRSFRRHFLSRDWQKLFSFRLFGAEYRFVSPREFWRQKRPKRA